MTVHPPTQRELGFATRQLHGGIAPSVAEPRPRATPIYLTAGFVHEDFDQAADHFATGDGYSYTRVANPTAEAVERRVAELERGAEALLVGSGQAALAVTLLGLLSTGDHVLASASLYEGSRGFLLENLPQLGIETSFVTEANDEAVWERAVRDNTRALFVESIPNPKNDITDLAVIARVAHRHGIPLIVDNTLATPYLLRPIEHGADIVIHSASKFLAGHGSVLGGLIVDNGTFDVERSGALFPQLTRPGRLGGPSFAERTGGRARIAYLREVAALRFGPTASPINAFLINQGIETLSLRVTRQSANALGVARWLEQQPEVHSVDYSGLESSPFHGLARQYLPDGQGSVFSFTLAGGIDAARRFVNALEVFTHMTHLGDVRSLILHPTTTSHTLRSADELSQAGIWPGTLRVSIGIEDLPDLIDDLERGLGAVRTAG
ncbi:O-acetylhomoserine (thiol)-lyase [Microbacteriaceae bacterium SG_E_30_P1]|uniref:O-acetylhomoserine (Thiol)-lyase n=1 Tax=Antiquaquibacter oligotrophicus TaxID=2880260 RepID=A0ABT6KKP7_9MICO|nr:PLP-dependent transferase [Antiquaquibacter oligotrophicus]MDH6180023.1 O-acetylhomoserine (thiol)-lyase [Antiquaquibacter oligotrophicus]UDF14223.1 PLP-dependent transferase [Antiquaquibacter oligotrophicus]